MPKMNPNYRSKEPQGTVVNVYGYKGIVGENGVIDVTVPESMAEAEIASGRMTVMPPEVPHTPPVQRFMPDEYQPSPKGKRGGEA